VRANIYPREVLDRMLGYLRFFHNHLDGIRLSSGSPTLCCLSRRPCECRLTRPRNVHGVGEEGGGPIYIQAATTAPQGVNGLPPKPDLIPTNTGSQRSGCYNQDTRL
jgi:hypothetical protein